MGLFDRLFNKKSKIRNSTQAYTSQIVELGGDAFTRGLDVEQPISDYKLSAVYKCRELISDSIAKIPFFVFDSKNGKKVMDHPLNKILQRIPNSAQNSVFFKKYMTLQILDKGNCYIYPIWNRNTLTVDSIRILDNATPIVDNDNFLIGYTITFNSESRKVRPDDLIHLRGSSQDGITGMSVLEYAKNSLEIAKKQSNFQSNFYSKATRPAGTLNVATDLSNKATTVVVDGEKKEMGAKDAVRFYWDKQLNSGSGTAVLDNGMQYNPMAQISPKDMEFVSTQDLSVKDIARFYKVPPSKLGVGTSTYSSREQEAIEYVQEAIQPYVDQICIELTNKLLLEKDQEQGYVIKADVDVELFADANTRINYIQKAIQSGIMTPSEGRLSEELGPAYKEGDQFVIGPNYFPVGQQTAGGTTVEQNSDDTSNDNNENDTKNKITRKGGNG